MAAANHNMGRHRDQQFEDASTQQPFNCAGDRIAGVAIETVEKKSPEKPGEKECGHGDDWFEFIGDSAFSPDSENECGASQDRNQ